jgi:dipeptidyl aminopeptidase/acylaminoacyl peptidase
VRGTSWSWNAEVQFLASRGYAVLQPEFRGSTGFGASHHEAGWKQWGRAMQDDLADGARWAIAQGIADPKRIAIAGASYGGYAALMGLVRDPDLYACAINWVGVTDLDLLFSATWSDFSPSFRRHGLPRLVGDRRADAAMLREHSPIHRAAEIKKPVLMAYGRKDRRVPIEHGERMRDALRRHNPNVEWVLYDEEGHGWHKRETNIDFWTRVEKFLARHLTAA